MSTMFGNIETIYSVNLQFLEDLKKAAAGSTDSKTMGEVFLEFGPYFKMYTDYVGNHDRATDLLAKIAKHGGRKYAVFSDFLKKTQKTCVLASLLITPIQRVPRYRLLLQELIKRSEDSDPDYGNLSKALELIKKTAAHINESVKRMDNARKVRHVQEKFLGSPEFVAPSRTFIMEGHLCKLADNQRYRQKYQFFLFNDLVVYADYRQLYKKYKVPPPTEFTGNLLEIYRNLPEMYRPIPYTSPACLLT
jgi:hypothetical protein